MKREGSVLRIEENRVVNCSALWVPSGVGDVDASEVNTLTAHDEERREAQERHAATDHG